MLGFRCFGEDRDIDRVVAGQAQFLERRGPAQRGEQGFDRAVDRGAFVRLVDGLHRGERGSRGGDEGVEVGAVARDRLVLGLFANVLLEKGVGPEGRGRGHGSIIGRALRVVAAGGESASDFGVRFVYDVQLDADA